MPERANLDPQVENWLRTILRRPLTARAEQTQEVLQRSRALIEEQIRVAEEEIRTCLGHEPEEIGDFFADSDDQRATALSVARLVGEEILQGVLATEWTWTYESDWLGLSASNAMDLPRAPMEQTVLTGPSPPPEPSPPEEPSPEPSPEPSLPDEVPDEGPITNSYAKQVLHEFKMPYIRDVVTSRAAVTLPDDNNYGYVFQWPPGQGIFCVLHCPQCRFTSNTDPLGTNNTFAALTHWRSKAHADLAVLRQNAYATYKKIMMECTFREVEGKHSDWIQEHNSRIKEMNEFSNQSKRKRWMTGASVTTPRSSAPKESRKRPSAEYVSPRRTTRSSAQESQVKTTAAAAANITPQSSHEPSITRPTFERRRHTNTEPLPHPAYASSKDDNISRVLRASRDLRHSLHPTDPSRPPPLPIASDSAQLVAILKSEDASDDEPMIGRRPGRPIVLD